MEEHFDRRASVGSETTLPLREFFFGDGWYDLSSRILASILPTMESRVIPR